MTKPEDFIEERLRRLGAATEPIAPSAGFDQWLVEAATRRAATRGLVVPWRVGGAALVVGALAAAASVLLALRMESALDEQVLVTADWVESGP
jgi:hypothetical protein